MARIIPSNLSPPPDLQSRSRSCMLPFKARFCIFFLEPRPLTLSSQISCSGRMRTTVCKLSTLLVLSVYLSTLPDRL